MRSPKQIPERRNGMSNDKENQIRFRLKILSQIEPKERAAHEAIEKVRDSLTKSKRQHESAAVRMFRIVFSAQTLKFATAAVILIGIGFIAGRLAVPAQPDIDMQQIQSMIDTRCAQFAEKTLAASSTLMDQRMNEMIGLIEAAREKDRQWVAAAFEKIENDRRADNNRVGNSLIALAARTNETK
jgi:hypothetical protein